MNKFIKEVVVLVLFGNSLLAMACQDDGDVTLILKKSWSDLVEQLGPYTLTANDLSVTDCPDTIEHEEKIGSAYQHIMFNDYMWNTYKLADGLLCVQLEKPEVGLLSAYEARVLLSASRGFGFEVSGLSLEFQEIVSNYKAQEEGCEEASVRKN